jgi:hypothetical protein
VPGSVVRGVRNVHVAAERRHREGADLDDLPVVVDHDCLHRRVIEREHGVDIRGRQRPSDLEATGGVQQLHDSLALRAHQHGRVDQLEDVRFAGLVGPFGVVVNQTGSSGSCGSSFVIEPLLAFFAELLHSVQRTSSLGCTAGGSDRTPRVSSTSVVPTTSANVSGVALVKPRSDVSTYCQEAADRLNRPILCPSLLPADPYLPENQPCGVCLRQGYFLIDEVFQGPPSYVGMPTAGGSTSGVGHLNIWSSPRGTIDTAGLGCVTKGGPTGTIDLDGTNARWIACPAGRDPPQDSGHIVLQWSDEGIVYAVSVHTDTPVNRRLALFIAEHLVCVEPRQ